MPHKKGKHNIKQIFTAYQKQQARIVPHRQSKKFFSPGLFFKKQTSLTAGGGQGGRLPLAR